MTDINLLPWRESLRNAAKKEFLIILAVVLGLNIFILAMSVKGIRAKIQRQEGLNAALENNISLLQKKMDAIQKIKIELNNLGGKKDALEKLQLERMGAARLLEQIAYQIPPGVYLTRLDKKDAQLTFEGLAESNIDVSEFMQKIARSRWIAEPHLTEMKTAGNKEGGRGYYFKMTARCLL